jgi:hypothetical protein
MSSQARKDTLLAWNLTNHNTFLNTNPGANPTPFEFTATTPAFLHQRKIFFVIKTRYAIT